MKAEILESGKIKLTAENMAEKVLLNQIVVDCGTESVGKRFVVSGNSEEPVDIPWRLYHPHVNEPYVLDGSGLRRVGDNGL